MSANLHPEQALFRDERVPPVIPSVDHYAGTESTMEKALALQARHPLAFDVTLDLEDGAPAGREAQHTELVVELLRRPREQGRSVGVRIHDVTSPHWQRDLDALVNGAGAHIAHVTIPKMPGARQAADMITYLQNACAHAQLGREIPVHVLIETHGGLLDAHKIAALPWVRGLDFGTMDFVSSHGGALSSACMRSPLQFDHALMRRAKAELVSAALAHGLVPVHGVTLAFRDPRAAYADARRARDEFGFLRMWSVHPSQIEAITEAFAPDHDEVRLAEQALLAGWQAHWAPVSVADELHDRASYRYAWQLLQRAHLAGVVLGDDAREAFFADG